MAIEIKQLQINTTVTNGTDKTIGDDQMVYEKLKKIKEDIVKESLAKAIEYFRRQKQC